jgi:hypothetical protein
VKSTTAGAVGSQESFAARPGGAQVADGQHLAVGADAHVGHHRQLAVGRAGLADREELAAGAVEHHDPVLLLVGHEHPARLGGQRHPRHATPGRLERPVQIVNHHAARSDVQDTGPLGALVDHEPARTAEPFRPLPFGPEGRQPLAAGQEGDHTSGRRVADEDAAVQCHVEALRVADEAAAACRLIGPLIHHRIRREVGRAGGKC